MDRANALTNSTNLPTAQAVTTAAAAGTAAPPIGHNRNSGKAAAAARHGKAWGRPVADQEQLQTLHAQGARLLAYGGEFAAFLNMLRERGEEFDQLLRATEQEGG